MKAAHILLAILLLGLLLSHADAKSDTGKGQQNTFQLRNNRQNKAYKYLENDGVFVFYETGDRKLYRQLLPKEFDMPKQLLVQLFVMDFYKIDSDAEPYKELSISLLARHDGKDVWHCIYMPVTSRDSMIAGKIGLGLPKTIGDIQFDRKAPSYSASIVDNQKRRATISLDIDNYKLSEKEEAQIKALTALPKVNIQRGKAIQMGRSGRAGNIIDTSKRFPHLLSVQGAKAKLHFDKAKGLSPHPFDMKPSRIIVSYYMHNKIPFQLGRKNL